MHNLIIINSFTSPRFPKSEVCTCAHQGNRQATIKLMDGFGSYDQRADATGERRISSATPFATRESNRGDPSCAETRIWTAQPQWTNRVVQSPSTYVQKGVGSIFSVSKNRILKIRRWQFGKSLLQTDNIHVYIYVYIYIVTVKLLR